MMTIEQAKIVATVYRKFLDSERREWNEFDDYMCDLSWLNDNELIVESHVLWERHLKENARCTHKHAQEECLVPYILESVEYILQDFADTKRLPKNTRYMLEYYLSFSQSGGIVTDY